MSFLKISIGFILIAGGGFWFLVSGFPVGIYIDPASVVMVYGITVPILLLAVLKKAANWADACLALGVPIGLLGGTVGATGMALFMVDPAWSYRATSIMLLTVLYGGVISAIGYFAQLHTKVPAQGPLSYSSFIWATIPLIVFTVWAMDSAASAISEKTSGNGAFISEVSIYIFVVVYAGVFLLRKSVRSQDLVSAALFASMLCLVAGLIQWYQSDGNDKSAIAVAMNGLNYGLFIYIVVYLWSLRNPTDRIEAGKANWHWMEVSAFLVFMLFAPETIRESLINQQDEQAAIIENAELEDRLALLEKRLALLEGS